MRCPACHADNPDTSKYCGACAALLPSPGEGDSVTRLAPHQGAEATQRGPGAAPDTGPAFAGKYRILSKIGQGGMGIVYKAHDETLGRSVALKVLPPAVAGSQEAQERFVLEARAAAALSHPNICVVHEVGRAEGQAYIAMEFVEGETLRDLVRQGALTRERIVDIAIQVAGALGEAHGKGVVHRDIKSANIMVTPGGRAKVMDFGLARLQGFSDLTKSRTTMGTVPYMSPEQARGEHVDHRTDIWSLGVVLYEMLSGVLPFSGESDLSVVHSIVHDAPKPLPVLHPPVPDELRHIVARALQKDRETRYGSADQMRRDLETHKADVQAAEVGGFNVKVLWRRVRRPKVAVPLVVALVALVALGTWFARHQARVRWARTVALPAAENIVSQNWRDFDEAYRLAEEAEKYIPRDPKLAELFAKCSFRIDVKTNPAGANVYVKPYTSPQAEWRYLGVSPIQQVRLPLGTFRWRIEKDGYTTVTAVASSWDVNLAPQANDVLVAGGLVRTLDRNGTVPPGMVRVAGAETPAGRLPDFFIDAHEVTNREYKAFVDSGGYANSESWTQRFVDDGKELTREDALGRFVDQTGRPGPATWRAGGYPEGQDDYPVSGVSWYEAAAYAAFAGKRLPTKEHWGLGRGEATPVIQWPQLGGDALFAPFSNFFRGEGPVAVGSLPGITAYGASDMAGNVREWCWNETPMGRLIRGGAWDDNTYMFGALTQAPPMDRSSRNGFRCVRDTDPQRVPAAAFDVVTLVAGREYTKETPVADAVFDVYKEQFSYDPIGLKSRVESTRESPEWKLQQVSFEAAYGGERVLAWLFLPKNAAPPFQTVIYFPGSAPIMLRSSEQIESYYEYEGFLSFIVKNGRAVLFPIYKGTFERTNDQLAQALLSGQGSRQYSELVVQQVKDFRRSVDYLATRPDIDVTKLAFYGMSWGATLGPIITAVEPRLEASVLLAGGLDLVVFRPESDPFNYASRVRVPTLMLNGKYDTLNITESSQRPLFDQLGAEDKRWLQDDTDHIPASVFYIRETLAWLDQYLGPVAR